MVFCTYVFRLGREMATEYRKIKVAESMGSWHWQVESPQPTNPTAAENE